MLMRILDQLSQNLVSLDLSDNYNMASGELFFRHFSTIELPNVKVLKLSGCFQLKSDFRFVKSYLRNLQPAQLLQFQLINNQYSYSPQAHWYYQSKIEPIIQQFRANFIKQHKSIKNIESDFMPMKFSIINDKIYSDLDHLYFVSDYGGKDLSIQQVVNFETFEKFVIIPSDSEFFAKFTNYEEIFLKQVGQVYKEQQNNSEMKGYLIFENFHISLLEFIQKGKYDEKLGLSKLDISKLLLDFYDKFKICKFQFFFHVSQLVLIKIGSSYCLKLLPFKFFFDYNINKHVQLFYFKLYSQLQLKDNEEEEVLKIQWTLNNFISSQVISNKLKFHTLRKYWQYIFSINSSKKKSQTSQFTHKLISLYNTEQLEQISVFEDKQTTYVQKLMKNIRGRKLLYDLETMQVFNVVMLIICDIYETQMKFKKGKDVLIQIDKFLLQFFLKLNEEKNEEFEDVDVEDLDQNLIENKNQQMTVDTFLADQVYTRLMQQLNQ